MPGGFCQHVGSRVVVEVGQGGGGVEADFEVRVVQGGFEERDRFGADRLQRQGGFPSRLDLLQLTAELLHPHLAFHVVLSHGDLADHLQVPGEVVPVLGVNLQHDRAVGFRVGQGFTDSVTVVRIKPGADPVSDAFGHSHAAITVLECHRQVAITPGDPTAGHSAPTDDPGQFADVALTVRNQDVSLGSSEDVSGEHSLPGNESPFRDVGFHQPATVEAGGFAAGWQPDLDIK